MVEFKISTQKKCSGRLIGDILSSTLESFYGIRYVDGEFSFGNVSTYFKIHDMQIEPFEKYASVVFKIIGNKNEYIQDYQNNFTIDVPIEGSREEFYRNNFIDKLRKL